MGALGFIRKLLPKQNVRMLEATSAKRWQNTPPFGALAAEIAGGAARVRGRARHLRHNDPLGANAAAIYRTALVGYGVTASTKNPELNTAFADWCRKTGFAELQAEIVDALVTDGEAIIVMQINDDGELQLQHIPQNSLMKP